MYTNYDWGKSKQKSQSKFDFPDLQIHSIKKERKYLREARPTGLQVPRSGPAQKHLVITYYITIKYLKSTF